MRKGHEKEEIEMIKKKYEKLGAFAIPCNQREDICFNMLSHALNVSSTILLKDIQATVEKFIKHHRKTTLDDLNILVKRLFCLVNDLDK